MNTQRKGGIQPKKWKGQLVILNFYGNPKGRTAQNQIIS